MTRLGAQSDRGREIVIAATAILTAALALLALLSVACLLNENRTPEDILSRYIDCVSSGDAEGGVGLTIHSLMNQSAVDEEVAALEDWMDAHRGFTAELLEVKGVAYEDLPRYLSGVIGDATRVLETEQDVEFDHDYSDGCGLQVKMVVQWDESDSHEVDTWFVFLKVDSSWYMIGSPNWPC